MFSRAFLAGYLKGVASFWIPNSPIGAAHPQLRKANFPAGPCRDDFLHSGHRTPLTTVAHRAKPLPEDPGDADGFCRGATGRVCFPSNSRLFQSVGGT